MFNLTTRIGVSLYIAMTLIILLYKVEIKHAAIEELVIYFGISILVLIGLVVINA